MSLYISVSVCLDAHPYVHMERSEEAVISGFIPLTQDCLLNLGLAWQSVNSSNITIPPPSWSYVSDFFLIVTKMMFVFLQENDE